MPVVVNHQHQFVTHTAAQNYMRTNTRNLSIAHSLRSVLLRRAILTKLVTVIQEVRLILHPITFSDPISNFAARDY